MFGLGCVAGAAGVARLHDYLRGAPDDVAVLVAVELCSLTFPALKAEVSGLVGNALFADGAAAVVAVGERRAERIGAGGPDVLDSRSHLYPDSLRTMGWDVDSSGLQLVLSADLPEVIERYLQADVTEFLATHDLGLDDIGVYVSHPVARRSSGDRLEPGPARRRAGTHLALTGRDRQHLLGLGAARAARHHGQAAAQRPRADDGDGAGVLLRVAVAQLALTQPWVGICS